MKNTIKQGYIIEKEFTLRDGRSGGIRKFLILECPRVYFKLEPYNWFDALDLTDNKIKTILVEIGKFKILSRGNEGL
jgi:hypothetical protein